MALKTYRIPRHVDDMAQFFFWEFDEFILFFAIWIGFIVIGYTLIGLALAGYVSNRFAKTKGNYLSGRLHHMAFHFGVLNLNKKFVHGGIKRVYYK